MNYKNFSLLFITGFIALALPVFITAMWLEPFDGDLTRISGNSENEFGWTIPQAEFSKNFSHYAINNKTIYQEEDIVVFGDSFSHIGSEPNTHKLGWQNFLADATGLSIYTYHINKTNVFTWLDQFSPSQKTNFIIYEQVERSLKSHADFSEKCNDTSIPAFPLTLSQNSITEGSAATKKVNRKPSSLLNLDDSIYWLKAKGQASSHVKKLSLIKTGLFSSENHSEILVFHEDQLLKESPLNPKEEKGILCFFKTLQEKVDAKGGLKLIIAIAPDKTTVYQSYIENISIDEKSHSVFSLLAAHNYPIFRYDLYFRNLVDQGIKDVYLPNDSHWGSVGNRHFASIIRAQMGNK